MQRPGLIVRVWNFSRLYLVSLILLGIFGWTMIQVYVLGVGPTPQQPPPGYMEERLNARLQWHPGNIAASIQLQVSKDDPEFKEPFVDKKGVSGNTHHLNNLEPGHTYYWRLIQNGKSSSTLSFKTSPNAVAF